MKKAVGYIKVRNDLINSPLNKLVQKGMEEICERKNWELIKIYQDKVTRKSSPKKASRKLFNDTRNAGKDSADITIIFCFGEYVIYGPDEIDFVLIEDLKIGKEVEKEMFIYSLKNA
ncbi:hypothetical protein [Paucisalibacillus globulus]|jgi:nickel-dependent lactate racemase|uniref:hypothetical protein n=1 Tax=Paucisalibacillus globulus TaxID=351095 RepID=UPI000405545A|nr:hypothetical protein [Paucisalibacillus globulus]